MFDKSERRAAREVVAVHHEARLIELVQRVGDAVDGIRAGELDAFQADRVIYQYSRAAKELWKFCNLSDVEFTASLIADHAPSDWWECAAATIHDRGVSGHGIRTVPSQCVRFPTP